MEWQAGLRFEKGFESWKGAPLIWVFILKVGRHGRAAVNHAKSQAGNPGLLALLTTKMSLVGLIDVRVLELIDKAPLAAAMTKAIAARELRKVFRNNLTQRDCTMYYLPKMLVRLIKTGETFVVQRVTGNGSLEIFDGVKKTIARPSELKRAN